MNELALTCAIAVAISVSAVKNLNGIELRDKIETNLKDAEQN